MVDRRKRRPLPACCHVGTAEVRDHIDIEQLGEPVAVTQLERTAVFGVMQNRMSVKADDTDISCDNICVGKQPFDCIGVHACEGFTHVRGRARPAKTTTQRLTETAVVGNRTESDRFDSSGTIRAQQRRIDAIHRGAAHQADGKPGFISAHFPPFRYPTGEDIHARGGVVLVSAPNRQRLRNCDP